jgi:hypothetical protein
VFGRSRASGAQALRSAFADAVIAAGDGDPASRAVLVGVEHEFRVMRGTAPVPFDRLIDSLDLGRRFLDPTDANARRLPSGAAVTCDDAEAEVALPPIAVAPGFTSALDELAQRERAALQARLEDDVRLVGVSTHLSVSVPAAAAVTDALARLYARTFAPALMLLLDRRESWGVYVRPRPGRLELCGEFARGERLQAAAAFAVGSTQACLAVVDGRAPASSIPPRLALATTPAPSRFGYTVWRTALGADLYAAGRTAQLPLAAGGTTTAQAQLEAAAGSVFRALHSTARADVRPLEHFVHGEFALPLPTTRLESVPTPGDRSTAAPASTTRPGDANPFGRVALPLRRPGYEMAPVMITWPLVVLVAAALPDRRRAFVCLPREHLVGFLRALDRGRLDRVIVDYLHERPGRVRLEHREQAASPGLYDRLGRRRDLLAEEPTGPLTTTAVAA